MKIYMMTDMEGVAGVMDAPNWIYNESRYYEMGKEFLTGEVNAAVDGFFEGGATEIVVHDGHGYGAINFKLLDPRVELVRGWPAPTWPCGLDSSYDFAVWVGQHSKACTPFGHLCHTQSFSYIDESVNGLSIGEFGQMALCASELGVRAIFAAGDLALTKEAQALFPGIETVAGKVGVTPTGGEELTEEEYEHHIGHGRHLHPERVRRLIREGARRAIQRARNEDFGIFPLKPPYHRIIKIRPSKNRPKAVTLTNDHPTSFIGCMNGALKDISEKQKRKSAK